MYQQITTGEEHYSSLSEILCWIDNGLILRPPIDPVSTNNTAAPITTPSHVPASIQYVTNTPHVPPAIVPPKATTPPNADTMFGTDGGVMTEQPVSKRTQKKGVLIGDQWETPG
jgi:hypothetical protein